MITHIIGVVEGIDSKIKGWSATLEALKSDLAAQNKMISEPFSKQAELEQKTALFNEVMAILNPKEEQVIGDGDETQYQRRKVDDKEQKRYNKLTYSEAETLFLQWENGSAPIGEVKGFIRFKKHRFYEKTAEGCIEITPDEYAEKGGITLYENIKRANRKIDGAAYSNGAPAERDIRNIGGDGNNGNAEVISRQAIGEELRNDTGRSVPSFDRYSAGISDGLSTDTQFQRRTSSLTNREVLFLAASEVDVEGLTDVEKEHLEIFKKRLDALYDLEQKRFNEGKLYKQQQFGKGTVDREAAEQT